MAGGATVSCADESRFARSPEADPVAIAGAAALTADATGDSRKKQPATAARISNGAKAIATSSRTLPLSVQQYVISVVIHDQGTLQTIDLMLSSWGYLTELYASAEEFLSAATTSEAACIVIDMHLGDISGVDLATRLAAMGFKVPIIIITESQDEQHRQQAMDFGCAAFLLKPFPADRLSEAIRKVIGLKLN